jgi:hypothetical protein
MGGPTIFISYRRGHQESLGVVADLEAALTHAGFQVLRDVDIEPGDRWSDELWRWLMECSGAVAVVSDAAAESDWCRREWSVLAARESQAGLRVVPVHVGPLGDRSNILDHLQGVPAGPDAAAAVAAVIDRLRGLPDAPPTTADYLAAHRAWLGWLYTEAPALGREPFSLADVYIDTECGALPWEAIHKESAIDPFSEEHGGRADMIETVLGYLGDPALREPVVVQGPAGSGKSAFTLRLANRLADEGLRPVLVRFRDLRLSSYDDVDELLQDAIRVAPLGEHPPPPAESVFAPEELRRTTRFRGAEISRTVIILDGWDEVTVTGSTRFQSQIEEWLPRLRQRFCDGAGPPVRLVLTGRPSAAVERSRFLRRATPVLTVRPMRPDQLEGYARRISDRLSGVDWRLDLDRCRDAFGRYRAWFERRDEGGTDVLGSPLLALLAFRMVAEWPDDTGDLFARPSALYNALIEITVAHAGKAEEGPDGTVHRGGESLRRLLQRVAAVITAQGTESVSFQELEGRLEDDRALLDWAEEATGESTLHELVVNFYFKSNRELGCEFLHKSFREYLFAEAIVRELETICGDRSGPFAPPERKVREDFAANSIHRTASRSLARLLSPEWLAPEVRSHVFWLIERAAAENRGRWVWIRDLLADVYSWWVDRAHLRIHPERRYGRPDLSDPAILDVIKYELPRDDRQWIGSRTTTSMDAHLGDALLQITAFVHSCLMNEDMVGTREHQSGQPGKVRFRPFGDVAQTIIARIAASPDRPLGAGLARSFLRGCDLSGANLAGAFLPGVNLNSAKLQDASFWRAELFTADLREADLRNAVLPHSDLHYADLSGADLTGADLDGTRFKSLRHDERTKWPEEFQAPE